jgi:hypothetical protein
MTSNFPCLIFLILLILDSVFFFCHLSIYSGRTVESQVDLHMSPGSCNSENQSRLFQGQCVQNTLLKIYEKCTTIMNQSKEISSIV